MSNAPYDTREETIKQTKKYFDFPELDYQLIFDDKEFDSSSQDTLILFHACWSGQSITNIRKILSTLINYDTTILKIYIADIDNISDDFKKNYLGQLSNGHGEAAWIENGQIRAKHLRQSAFDTFADFIDKRLKRKN